MVDQTREALHFATNIHILYTTGKTVKWVSVNAFNSLFYKVLKTQLRNDPKSKAQSQSEKHLLKERKTHFSVLSNS